LTVLLCMAKLAHLMVEHLPFSIEPAMLALSGEKLEGEVPLKDMSRLAELALITDENAKYNLAFSKDEKGIVQISGDISTTLVMLCQRCLNNMPLTLNIPVSVGIVTYQDEIGSLAKDLEPYPAEECKISLLHLIEEEILLSLPMVPFHSNEECSATAIISELKAKPVSPFEVLKKINEGKQN